MGLQTQYRKSTNTSERSFPFTGNVARNRLAGSRCQEESMLREVAYVLHLTRSIKQAILNEKSRATDEEMVRSAE